MPPSNVLPVSDRFTHSSPDEYITALLAFADDPFLRTLCGGIHILDFFTRDSDADPKDIYRTVLPADWIAFFALLPIDSILDLLMRTPLAELSPDVPPTLRTYIESVRAHTLDRTFQRRAISEETKNTTGKGTEWALNAGMKPKKIHEVENFAAFLDHLVRAIQDTDRDAAGSGVSHVVDYGSGQAYLSRTVAKKYGHNVVGIESRTVNIDGAKRLDKAFDNVAVRKLKRKFKQEAKMSEQEKRCKEGECEDVHTAGSLQYVQTFISDGNIDEVVTAIPETGPAQPKSLLLTSLHSCGNLVHHALSAFKDTPSVRAVALVGCCYNLLTEKNGKTFKHPSLRNPHPRLIATSTAGDPQGFPISATLTEKNVQLNITARSMACQAPQNWTSDSSADFFLRHFYRALLQRIFLDKGMIDIASSDPVIIGSLRKPSYESFPAYVAAAITKMGWEERCKISNEEAESYLERFIERKKELSVVWSLMAFSAGIMESIIVVDRWLYLREMGCTQAWVEAAFEHSESPRNFVVVGVR